MSAGERKSLTKTIVAVLVMMVVLGSALIVDLARRPAGALNVPKGYAVAQVTVTDYAIQAPATLLKGNYEFVLTNHGSMPHELVMFATKAPADALPLRKDGSVDEESDQLSSVLDSGSSLAAGETRILFADLTEPGHYALVCNLPMHYRLGMHHDLTVH